MVYTENTAESSQSSLKRAEDLPAHLQHQTGKFINRRKESLGYLALFPSRQQTQVLRGVVFFLHDLHDHSGRYYDLYETLCEYNYGVVAYDLISHGKSDTDSHHVRGHARKFNYFVGDTQDFMKYVQGSILPSVLMDPTIRVPMILVGMSFGSVVGLHAMLNESKEEKFDGVIAIAPGVAGNPLSGSKSRFRNAFGALLAKIKPTTKLPTTIHQERMTNDPAYEAEFSADPLTVTDPLTIRMTRQSRHAMKTLQDASAFGNTSSRFAKLPLLVMMGSSDTVVSQTSATVFYKHCANRDKHMKVFDNMYHNILHERESEDVHIHMLEWLRERF